MCDTRLGKGVKMEIKDVQRFDIVKVESPCNYKVEAFSCVKEVQLQNAVIAGPRGISPTIEVVEDTFDSYILGIKDANQSFLTPNLKGKDGVFESRQLKISNPKSESLSGEESFQSAINEEFKQAILKLEFLVAQLTENKIDKPQPHSQEGSAPWYSLSKDLSTYLFGDSNVNMRW